MRQHVLDLETLLRVPHVDSDHEFNLSPDGTQIAFSYNLSGQWEVYLMPLDGAAPPRQITTGPGAKFAPRWSPDGRRLAYVLDLDGGELFDIYVYDLATGQHANLTPDTPDAIQPNFSWSPDGSQIAFISDRSGGFDTYVMPATGGPARAVFSIPNPDWEVHWSPAGHWLAIVVEASGQDYATYIVPAAGGGPRPIGYDGEMIPAKDARWSPDSARVAFSSDLHGFFNIGIYEVATGEIAWVTEGKGDKEQPIWSPDGWRLAYVLSDGPVTSLAVLDLEKGSLETYQVEPGVHYRPRFTSDGAGLVFVFDNPRHPDDLWLLSLRPPLRPFDEAQGRLRSDCALSLPKWQALADGSLRQLTRSLPPDLQDDLFVMPTTVCYPSLDGQDVPAILYRPRQTRGLFPAIVYLHGGPNWLTQVTWDPLVQHMVSRGWVVLAPNYRGSTGYGREWQLANRFDLGGVDTKDVVAGADYLIREGLAHPALIAVSGRSWGGYLTMTSLTQYPDRWAGGSAVVPFLNWFTAHANSREDLQHWDRENFGDPEKDYDLYYERSPFFFLGRVTAPVQLICGAHDPRCPASESIQAHDVLASQGKPCDFVLYADEGHIFLKIENVVDAKKRRVEFLARVLSNPVDTTK
ncbi:MAG: S9 family peptidase [Chloroflexota bacterium]|nr:S9 family peptidase [Chloroflexota bacterium]